MVRFDDISRSSDIWWSNSVDNLSKICHTFAKVTIFT